MQLQPFAIFVTFVASCANLFIRVWQTGYEQCAVGENVVLLRIKDRRGRGYSFPSGSPQLIIWPCLGAHTRSQDPDRYFRGQLP
jgi:hypothetical protein